MFLLPSSRRVPRWLLVIAAMFWSLSAKSAEIFVEHGQITIDGEIRRGDAQKFARVALKDVSAFLNVVNLNSTGGNVAEALKISQLLRASFGQTFVRKHQRCFSACFIIWAGGVTRLDSGAVGVHRLSLPNANGDLRAWESSVTPASQAVTDYLRSVGMPEKIIAKMQATPASMMFSLSHEWLISEDLDTQVLEQPAFLDLAEKQCGRQPAYAAIASGSRSDRNAVDSWNSCADQLRRKNQEKDIAQIVLLLDRVVSAR